jgi:toxin ParE1/3/4
VKPVHRRSEVILDLADIYNWIGADSPDTAERFLTAVVKTFAQIPQHPAIGWRRSWHNEKLCDMRSWRVENFPNFLVFYREEEATIEIYAVLHGARHLVRALRRR